MTHRARSLLARCIYPCTAGRLDLEIESRVGRNPPGSMQP